MRQYLLVDVSIGSKNTLYALGASLKRSGRRIEVHMGCDLTRIVQACRNSIELEVVRVKGGLKCCLT